MFVLIIVVYVRICIFNTAYYDINKVLYQNTINITMKRQVSR